MYKGDYFYLRPKLSTSKQCFRIDFVIKGALADKMNYKSCNKAFSKEVLYKKGSLGSRYRTVTNVCCPQVSINIEPNMFDIK